MDSIEHQDFKTVSRLPENDFILNISPIKDVNHNSSVGSKT